jgi:RNA polymerase sigma-70 factor (ECF subfamily)
MTVVSLRDRDAVQTKGRLDDRSGERFDQKPRIDDENNMAPAQDDHARFARLVLPHLGDAYSLARWITGNRADAEDVVQDACLRAFRAVGSIGNASARPWVLTVVRNTAYTWLRKNRPSAVLAVENLEDVETANAKPGDPDSETPETALIARADAVSLQAAIMALPTAYRETLILRDVQGLSYREIGEVTGVPIGTVMSRLARGRNHVIKTIGRTES